MNFQELFKANGDFKNVPALTPNKWLLIFAGVSLCLTGFSTVLGYIPGMDLSKEASYFTGLLLYPAVIFGVALLVLKGIGVNFKLAILGWAGNFKRDALLGISYFSLAVLLAWLLSVAGWDRFLENSKSVEITAILQGKPSLLYPLFFSVVVLAPLGEEIVFKRLLYVGLRHMYSIPRAILASSLLFVLLHPRSGFLPMILFVPITYYMYERHHRLPANIILHALINLAGIWGILF